MDAIKQVFQRVGKKNIPVPGSGVQHEERITALEERMTAVVTSPEIGINTVAIGHSTTFTVSAQSMLCPCDTGGAAIETFVLNVPELGIKEQTFPAVNNAAVITFVVPDTMPDATELHVTVQAVDELGNRSRWKDHIVMAMKGRVQKPVLSAPQSGETISFNAVGVTIKTMSFAWQYVEDTHKATNWKITRDPQGADIVAEAMNSGDLLSHTFEDVLLHDGITYYAFAQHIGEILGQSAWSQPTEFLARRAKVVAPAIDAPQPNAEIIFNGSDGVRVSTGQFTVFGATDEHVKTDWKITSDPQGQNILAQANDSLDLLTHLFLNPSLIAEASCYVFARHHGRMLGASDWSSPRQFYAKSAYVKQPVIIKPLERADVIFNGPGVEVKAGEFSVNGSVDEHFSTDWLIAEDEYGRNVVAKAENSADLTSHTFKNLNLEDGKIYYALARFNGKRYGASGWSAGKPFVARAAYVEKPTIASPTGGVQITWNADGVTVQTGDFSVYGDTDTHQSTDYKITTDSDGTDIVTQALASGDLTNHKFTAADLGQLTDGATYYAFARHNGQKYGPSDWSLAGTFTANNGYVQKPSITIPASGASVVFNDNGITCGSSVFSPFGATDTHKSSSWKICTDAAGNYPVAILIGSDDLLSHTFSADDLATMLDGQTCYAFVRHEGEKLGQSPWSEGTSFKAKRAYVKTPQISGPTQNALIVANDTGIVMATNAFEVEGATDLHESSDWKITSDTSGNIAVLQALESTDKVSHTFTPQQCASLAENTNYYAWARHTGGKFGDSGWAGPVAFKIKKAFVKTPQISGPTQNAVIISNDTGIVMTTGAFAVEGATDSHESSDWKITTDVTGNAAVLQAMESGDKLSHTFTPQQCASLAENTNYYAWARHNGGKFGNSGWAGPVTLTVKKANIAAPSISSPASGATINVSGGSLTVTTSPFKANLATDTHASTDWKITSDAAGNTVIKEDLNSTDKTSHTFTGLKLTGGQVCYLWARHKGGKFGLSPWSAAVNFTAQMGAVAKPSITSPAANANVVANLSGLTLASSAFSAENGTDTHKSTDWRITTEANGGTVVAQANGSTDLTSHTFTGLSLTVGTTYYASCRHEGNNFGYSPWSAGVPFKASEAVGSHGFSLYRHSSGKGTVINYKAADGTLQNLLVLDAQYRSVQKFGTYGTDVPGLTNFTQQGASGWYVIGNTALPHLQPLPDTVTNDAIYNQWHATLAADKTAKENCDIWMTYNNQTDSQGIKGVPAVAWCRNQIVDGKPCDLANEYETIVLWACGDKLDEMDPTAASYPDLRLGYTSTTAWPNYGRCQKFNGQQSDRLFSSTEYVSNGVRHVNCNGTCSSYGNSKSGVGTVVPVQEI